MGNTSSRTEETDEVISEDTCTESIENDVEGLSGTKENCLLQLTEQLFDLSSLRTMAYKIDGEAVQDILSVYQSFILRWIEEHLSRSETTVTMREFCDMLTSKGASEKEAALAFQVFDTDGIGTAELQDIEQQVKSLSDQSKGVFTEPERSIHKLKTTSLIHDVGHIFLDEAVKDNYSLKVLKFLIQNRAPSSSLSLPILKGVTNVMDLRLALVKSSFKSMDVLASEELLRNGEEVQKVQQCICSVEVSTNPSDSERLLNGNPSTYWQSNGTCRSHWIRLRIKNNVVLKHLSINVSSLDQSYMPRLVSISAGKSTCLLKEIKELRIPNHINGDFILLENLTQYFPIIQINIKRCHSDGCDTRVHAVKAVGYRLCMKESGLSVSDASAVWFIQLLSLWIPSVLPNDKTLKRKILLRTKSALTHMQPLSLSQASNERPYFLSKNVLKEVDNFLTDVVFSSEGQVVPADIDILFTFNLARGSVKGLITTIKLLQNFPDLNLSCSELMKKMVKCKKVALEKQSISFHLPVCGCDGGHLENNNSSSNSNSTSTLPDIQVHTIEGRKSVNLFMMAPDFVTLTKLTIKVASGSSCSRQGLVFVYGDQNDFCKEEHAERFSVYDKWTKEDIQSYFATEHTGPYSEDDPVAAFHFEDSCDELEIPVLWHPEGKYVLVKFLESICDSNGKLGVRTIQFLGFHKKVAFSRMLPSQTLFNMNKELMDVNEIQNLILNFLIDLAQVQFSTKKVSRLDVLDVDDIPVQDMWNLFCVYMKKENFEKAGSLLHLFHSLLPVMTSLNEDQKATVVEMFEFSCNMLDADAQSDNLNPLYKIVQQLVYDGAAVFFPDQQSRSAKLLQLMGDVEKLIEKPSAQLVFRSLCQFYTSADPMSLLYLPSGNLDKAENFDYHKTLTLLENLVSVIYRDFCDVVNQNSSNDQLLPLHNLFTSLQATVTYWCWQHFNSNEENNKAIAKRIFIRFCVTIAEKVEESFQFLLTKTDNVMKVLGKLDKLFPSLPFRQLLILLSSTIDVLDPESRCLLVQHFKPILFHLRQLSHQLHQLFPDLSHHFWVNENKEDVILKVWKVESPSGEDNKEDISQVFLCPGASKMVVTFDNCCETEGRFDYLQFIDSSGKSFRFHDKVGTANWPSTFTFEGSSLYFTCKPESFEPDWEYQFRVTARGSADTILTWPYDMLLLLTKFLGQLCASTMSANPVTGKTPIILLFDEMNEDLCDSSLWRTIFRGGYVTPVIHRSLSGNYSTDSNPDVLDLLKNMNSDQPGCGQRLLQRCREHCKSQKIGGSEFDQMIAAVFSALLWHHPDLREELENYSEKPDMNISPNIYAAYNLAETQRKKLMSERQKIAVEADKAPWSQAGVQNPVQVCQQKSLFLLKFAGLNKCQLKGNSSSSDESFKLVMEFIENDKWSIDKVQKMLKERSEYAKVLGDIYSFIAEFITEMSDEKDILQIPVIVFLQELLSHQTTSLHYCQALDGCGLELENNIRCAFYKLVEKLLDAFYECKKQRLSRVKIQAFNYYQAFLLHILDIHWQMNDLVFLTKIDLVTFLFTVAKENMITKNCQEDILDESEELEEYQRHMKMLKHIDRQDVLRMYEEKNGEEKKDMVVFMSKFSMFLEMKFECNSCQKRVHTHYKCLQCAALDFCASCVTEGCFKNDKENEDHNEDHDIIYIAFQCDLCCGYIMGTRVQCEDCHYHVCFGCYKFGQVPSHHKINHKVKIIPRLKSKSIVIETYIQQHAWLLYCCLALQLNRMTHQNAESCDTRYHELAVNLNNNCINMVLNDLLKGFSENELNFLKGPPQIETCEDQFFPSHIQFKLLCLLGTLFSGNSKSKISTNGCENISLQTFSHFLKTMLKISFIDTNYDNTTRLMATGLLTRLLCTSSLKAADEAMEALGGDFSHFSSGSTKTGEKIINFLLHQGAYNVECGNTQQACTIACMIQKLNKTEQWNSLVVNCLYDCISPLLDKLATHTEGSSSSVVLFSMFVLTGFPQVPATGRHLHYRLNGQDRQGIVLKSFSDKRQTLIADTLTKKVHCVDDDSFSITNEGINISTCQHQFIELTINLIKHLYRLFKDKKKLCTDLSWVMALLEKLLQQIYNNLSPLFVKDVHDPELIQCLVDISSLGTGLSKHWLLNDLELLMLLQYMLKSNSMHKIKKSGNKLNSGSSSLQGGLFQDCDMLNTSSVKVEKLVLDDLSDIENIHSFRQTDSFEVIVENFLSKKANDSSTNDLLTATDDVTPVVANNDQSTDSGLKFLEFTGVKEVTTSCTTEDLIAYEDLITASGEVQKDIEQNQNKKSAELLQKEYKSHVSDIYLLQLARSIVILYSRQLLVSLLSAWPSDAAPIGAKLFGVSNGYQLSCIFDFLHNALPQKLTDQAIQNGTKRCDPVLLPQVALMACQFLEEDQDVVLSRESKHSYDFDTRVKEKIHVPGASYLTVTFDDRCSTEEDIDELEFSTSPNFQSNFHEVSGESRTNWPSFHVPGDSLYYNFSCESDSPYWGYKFTVVAGFQDCFSTGYLILQTLLSSPISSCLPLNEMWSHLVHVTCKQTLGKRLDTIYLLLRILHIQLENPENKRSIDLTLLRPLWKLYVSLSQGGTQQSSQQPLPIQRALTELFLHTENLAVEWDIKEEYLLSLQEPKEILAKVFRGACVIAAIGLALGVKNSALEAIFGKSKLNGKN
ncbi:zinc finger ZZ-type and EF-hand domain-containing protein 1 [Argonauta hians]